MTAAVTFIDDGAVRIVTLSNPKKKNALTRAMLADLVEIVSSSTVSSGMRVMILQGDDAGGAFSAGFDVSTIDDDERARGIDPIAPVVDALAACEIPVIAVLDGPAMGGAFEIALSTTIRVGGPLLSIMMPPARLGLAYTTSGLSVFLARLSKGTVARLFLSAAKIGADEALRVGLIDTLSDDPGRDARRLAFDIASLAPLAVSAMTQTIARHRHQGGFTDDDQRALDALRDRTLLSNDLEEGVRAFKEKRAPVFTGK